MNKIELTVSEIEEMLNEQKKVTADYITRNLSVYHWFYSENKLNTQQAKDELMKECLKSSFPSDFLVLKKYIK